MKRSFQTGMDGASITTQRGLVAGPTLALPLTFVINGIPRTKKNSSRVVRCGPFTKVLPSAAYLEWHAKVLPQIQRIMAGRDPLTGEVNCRAIFLRDRKVGDACNFYQALADTLQSAGVLKNDSQIRSWDGSRLDVDRRDPRVIVTLEEIAE